MKYLYIFLFISVFGINSGFASTSSNNIKRDTSTNGTYYPSPKYAPEYPGGMQAFSDFLNKNFHLPANVDSKLTTKMGIEFIVEIEGNITHISTFGNTGAALNNEFVRVMQLSLRWQAGMFEYKKNKTVTRAMCMLAINITRGQIILQDAAKQTTQDSIDHQLVFTRSGDVAPAFPSGERGFAKFLTDNVRYPRVARRNNVTGRVFLQFIIETDGSLSHLQVLRDPGSGLGDETVRVLSLSPNWIPNKINGQAVRTFYTVPVNFSLRE